MIVLILTVLDLLSTVLLGIILLTSPCLNRLFFLKFGAYFVILAINVVSGIILLYIYWYESSYRKGKVRNGTIYRNIAAP